MPRSLDLDRLRRFEAERPGSVAPSAAAPVSVSPSEPLYNTETGRWPSREPVADGQISIKAPLEVIARFRRLCRDDRRTYADMLAILMDSHEGQGSDQR